MLWKQKSREEASTTASLRIYDRTVVDNLCYLAVRGGNSLYERLAPDIGAHARRYDLVIDVRLAGDDYSHDTRCVTGPEIIRVRETLDHFLTDYGLPVHRVVIDPNNFANSIDHAVGQVAERVRTIAIGRRFHPSKLKSLLTPRTRCVVHTKPKERARSRCITVRLGDHLFFGNRQVLARLRIEPAEHVQTTNRQRNVEFL